MNDYSCSSEVLILKVISENQKWICLWKINFQWISGYSQLKIELKLNENYFILFGENVERTLKFQSHTTSRTIKNNNSAVYRATITANRINKNKISFSIILIWLSEFDARSSISYYTYMTAWACRCLKKKELSRY